MLLNTIDNYHNHIEVILTYTLIGIIIVKIVIRIFFAKIYAQTNDPFVPKNNNLLINYQEINKIYFSYFNINIPNINTKIFTTNKFKHYNIKTQEIINLSIPQIINTKNLNGFNLDYILVHNWLYKYHLKHKIIAPIQKFLVYYAYDICSLLFYIFIIVRIFLLIIFLKISILQSNPILKQINQTHILTIISVIIFFLSLILIAYGVLIKHRWEKHYEKESIEFVEKNFSEYSSDFLLARSFSKKHKFAIYFRPKKRNNYNQQTTISQIIIKDKYLGPFVVIKNSRYRRNR